MIKNEKLLVYPYNIEFSPILRHSSLLKGYEISCLVSPKGWGLTGKDAGLADHGQDTGIIVSGDFEKSLGYCDTVMFIESHFPLDFNKNILNKIKLAAKNKKNIICLLKLECEVIRDIEFICKCENVYFKYIYEEQKVLPEYMFFNDESIEKINVPVILVTGMAERTNKFEIQLALREKIHGLGYKISQVGSRSYCGLMGFHSFPSFMYQSNISEVNKVLLFNSFIKNIENTEEPDIIIIGIPGGTMPFNRTFTNKFGILAFEICQAVTADVAILSLLYEDYKREGFEVFANSIRYKLGFNVDCINISNAQFDWDRAYDEQILSYISIDSNYIDQKIINYGNTMIPLFNILNGEDSDRLVDFTMGKLIEYGNVEMV